MKMIISVDNQETIRFDCVDEHEAIFAKKEGRIKGMVVKERDGWILRTGGKFGSNGHKETLEQLIESNMGLGYKFFIEEK